MSSQTFIRLSDAFGNDPQWLKDWTTVDYARVENGTAPITLTLPGHYSEDQFTKDRRIEVWRSVDGASPYLDLDTLYLIDDWEQHTRGKLVSYSVYGQDLNCLLDRRWVDYAEGVAQADKTALADNLGKAIMRENFGASATDATRSIASLLTVAPDLGAAPSVHIEFADRRVSDVLRDIAALSFQRGTYLVFDVVAATPPTGFEFRSYTGQRGVDHRFPGGSPPLLIGPDFGNLVDATVSRQTRQVITRAISLGSGLGLNQAKQREDDATLQGESPFGLIEGMVNASRTGESTALQAAARSYLKASRPRRALTATLSETSGLRYGIDWKWGDFVTAQVRGRSFDCHIPGVRVVRERDGGETVTPTMRGSE